LISRQAAAIIAMQHADPQKLKMGNIYMTKIIYRIAIDRADRIVTVWQQLMGKIHSIH
jgi:hypothetical protein